MRHLILLFSLSFLAGCAFQNLTQLRIIDPDASDFSGALAAEYLSYANAEAEQDHPLSAEYFANKGIEAWHGKRVPPEPVENFLPKPAHLRLTAARGVLIALLTDDIKRVVPQQAARAQLLFDCWAKQAAQRKKDASACAEEFELAIAELQNVATSFGLGSETEYNIPFVSGSSRLGKTARKKTHAIAAKTGGHPAYVIELEGRVDSAKAKRLFAARVQSLKQALAGKGIAEEKVRVKGSAGDKAVHLSRDNTVKDRNMVRATLRIFGADGKAAHSH